MMPPLLKAAAVADLLNVPVTTVYKLGREKILRAVRIGRSMRWEPAVVEKFIEQGGTAAADEHEGA